MDLIIRQNTTAPEEEWITLPYSDMEGLMDLFLSGRDSLEMTESQVGLIDFFLEKSNMVICSDVNIFIDVDDLPMKKSSFPEDRQFLLKLIEMAKTPEALKKIYMKPDTELVYPALDRFAKMIEQSNAASTGQDEAEPGDNMLFFKMGQGWRACRDAKRNLYTAERSWRGFYQLCEIDKEAYDKLGTDAMGDETAEKIIGNGRPLFEADDDYYTMPYCEVHDQDYDLIAPWSKAKKRYEKTYRSGE